MRSGTAGSSQLSHFPQIYSKYIPPDALFLTPHCTCTALAGTSNQDDLQQSWRSTNMVLCWLFTLRSAAELLTLSCGRRCMFQPPLGANITSSSPTLFNVDASALLKYIRGGDLRAFDDQRLSSERGGKKSLDMFESAGESLKKTSSSSNSADFLKSLHILLRMEVWGFHLKPLLTKFTSANESNSPEPLNTHFAERLND